MFYTKINKKSMSGIWLFLLCLCIINFSLLFFIIHVCSDQHFLWEVEIECKFIKKYLKSNLFILQWLDNRYFMQTHWKAISHILLKGILHFFQNTEWTLQYYQHIYSVYFSFNKQKVWQKWDCWAQVSLPGGDTLPVWLCVWESITV